MNKLRILFQGDSLTDMGRNKDYKGANAGLGSGFVSAVAFRLLFEYPEIEIYNRGVFGNRIADMYARWQEDALNIPFDIVSILNGVNDIGFGIRKNCGADAKKFEFIYDRLLYETKESKPNAHIVLCCPFLIKRICEQENDIYEDWERWKNAVDERAEIVKTLAKRYKCICVDFENAINSALERACPEHWSADCIHMTCAGNELLAREWLTQVLPLIEKCLREMKR